jgi:hypothetical protein
MFALVASGGLQCSGNITSSRASLWHSCVVGPSSRIARDADGASHNGYAVHLSKEGDPKLRVDNSGIFNKSPKGARI